MKKAVVWVLITGWFISCDHTAGNEPVPLVQGLYECVVDEPAVKGVERLTVFSDENDQVQVLQDRLHFRIVKKKTGRAQRDTVRWQGRYDREHRLIYYLHGRGKVITYSPTGDSLWIGPYRYTKINP